MIGTNAGPHELAGKQCNELFFTTSWQNDDTPEAMGKVMQDQGITDVYVMAPNYAAGKDMVNGFKRSYKGRIVDEVYTRLGQTDYQAELSQLRSKNPKAVFVFLSRRYGHLVPAPVLGSGASRAVFRCIQYIRWTKSRSRR